MLEPRGEWSSAARSVWGKTDRDSGAFLPLVQHLEDAAGVAGLLWDTWLPEIVRRRLAIAVGGRAEARTLAVFLAGVHDIGKATPAFAQLANDVGMSDLVSAMARRGLDGPTLSRTERVRHTLTGHIALEDWLQRRFGWSPIRAAALASIVSSHHGNPSDDTSLRMVENDTRSMGGSAWSAVRDEILEGMAHRTAADGVLTDLRSVKFRLPHLVDLCAIIVMADWIASDTTRFPYDRDLSSADQLALVQKSLDLRAPWRPRARTEASHAFGQAFPHVGSALPSALQSGAYELAHRADPGSLMVIEAPTGSGKSEAALLAAEAMALQAGAGGVFLGLPTMATSNAMFGRVLQWLDAWPGAENPSLWLAHGKAALNDDFAGLVRESCVTAIYDDDDVQRTHGDRSRSAVRVSSWFSGRRRGLLAGVVVGTVDQVLLGALQARHLALRHLALSSKVVIIDEVHATDVYMRSYLQRMLAYLGAYGTPVLLLSATLPSDLRDELTHAYQQGRRAITDPQQGGLRQRGSIPVSHVTETYSDSTPDRAAPYPLLTLVGRELERVAVEQDQPVRSVQVEAIADDLPSLVQRLSAALKDGGVVGVIRNTVSRAQATVEALREVFGDDVELFHSRFVALDRAARERDLVIRLGPRAERPSRLIVVGTQVLEQSLDIDLDLLITDLAPLDLLIQRCGRLHRHQRPEGARPGQMGTATVWLTGVEDWSAPAPRAVRGSRAVYQESLLLRAAAVLLPHLSGRPVMLPSDVPGLVAHAFAASLEPPRGWEDEWSRAEERRTKAEDRTRSKAGVFQIDPPTQKVTLTGWVPTPRSEERDETQARAQVRDSEDGIEVILLIRSPDGTLRLPAGSFEGAGQMVPETPEDGQPVTRLMAGCTVALPQALTNPGAWDATVSALEADPVADSWQASRWLAGQLALVLLEPADGGRAGIVLNGHHLTYDDTSGLTVTSLQESAEP